MANSNDMLHDSENSGVTIPISPDEKVHEAPHYELHLAPEKSPTENKVALAPQSDSQNTQGKIQRIFQKIVIGREKIEVKGKNEKQESSQKMNIKVWSTLEWLATSALIFAAIFFMLNYSAYSELFILKMERLKGEVKTNPYLQELIKPNIEKTEQKLLPVAPTIQESRKEIPPINMIIAPPDDRIIIPNINKNVPIVKVSEENLLKRDWGALENDIQQALQEGVVHYPGTAQPGSHGNVVITGHSSYYPLDPGRFKDVFAALHYVKIGENLIVYHNQKPYLYKIYDIYKVSPDKVEVLTQDGEDRLTLITCTPIGTNVNRLVVLAKPVNQE